jgi:hypothetical protein
VAADLGAQVFLSTHSLDLIDTFSTNEILVVDSTKSKITPIGANTDLVSALIDANVVDVSALSRLLSSRKLVIVEDEDLTILKAIDKTLGSQLFSAKSRSYVLSAKGVGNFRALAELGRVLKGLTGTQFELTFIQDRDGMPDFISERFLAAQTAEGVKPNLLDRHEIENYLIEPPLFQKAASVIGRELTQEKIRETILLAADALKAKARMKSLDTTKQVNRHLPAAQKLSDQEAEEKLYQWFDALDVTSVEQIQRAFPGKELLPEILKRLNEGQDRAITRGLLVASLTDDVVAPDMKELITSVAGDN